MPAKKKGRKRKPTIKAKLTKDLRRELKATNTRLRELKRDLKSLTGRRKRL